MNFHEYISECIIKLRKTILINSTILYKTKNEDSFVYYVSLVDVTKLLIV